MAMDTTPHFKSARTLIVAARRHETSVDDAINAFFDKHKAERIFETNKENTQLIYKLRFTAALPDQLDAMVKDACSNLRDALDHAVYGAVVCLEGGDPEKTGFPFGATPADVERELTKKLRGVPAELGAFLRSLRPHKGGNDILYSLNSLRNPSIHRKLAAVLSNAAIQEISYSGTLVIRGETEGASMLWDPVKQEIELGRFSVGTKATMSSQILYQIQFANIPEFAGLDVRSVIEAFAAEVEKAVNSIEFETKRIFLNQKLSPSN